MTSAIQAAACVGSGERVGNQVLGQTHRKQQQTAAPAAVKNHALVNIFQFSMLQCFVEVQELAIANATPAKSNLVFAGTTTTHLAEKEPLETSEVAVSQLAALNVCGRSVYVLL